MRAQIKPQIYIDIFHCGPHSKLRTNRNISEAFLRFRPSLYVYRYVCKWIFSSMILVHMQMEFLGH